MPGAAPAVKRAVTIWMVFFPLNLLATVTLGRLLADTKVILRVAVTTLTLTPIMTYLLLPWIAVGCTGDPADRLRHQLRDLHSTVVDLVRALDCVGRLAGPGHHDDADVRRHPGRAGLAADQPRRRPPEGLQG